MKVTIINFFPQLTSISACDMIWLSENYLLMLMVEVSLSLVYHVISVTYAQFFTVISIFCMENCKKISYCKSSSNVKSKLIRTRRRNVFENVCLKWRPLYIFKQMLTFNVLHKTYGEKKNIIHSLFKSTNISFLFTSFFNVKPNYKQKYR